MNLVEFNRQKIFDLCKLHKVKSLFVFGSILTPQFDEKSDIDFVVDFKDMPLEEYADNYLSLKDSLCKIFNREVDLIEEKGIRNKVLRANIARNKHLIYG